MIALLSWAAPSGDHPPQPVSQPEALLPSARVYHDLQIGGIQRQKPVCSLAPFYVTLAMASDLCEHLLTYPQII